MMRVLIACEFSGIVREAFKARGHDAWSCDLLDTEIPGQHIKGDVIEQLDKGWDLMIGHPPCTYISYAGTRHWNNSGRVFLRIEALTFFAKLWEAPIGMICLENPKGCASPTIAKYTQEIQPYYFGDNDMKTTWLWLKNLPQLLHSEIDTLFENRTHTEKPTPHSFLKTTGKPTYFTDGKTRDPHIRSKTFQGIAEAMANQWG
ncbi:hypothetical protein LCGC14_1205380 [marine sediment metagenome]|uniref:DNA (cytosine-5-)-methyltransferase n=1 Tax=marine sediment metagenome TaxID=412755 RepID=A0A0F9LFM5_9ZZZZ